MNADIQTTFPFASLDFKGRTILSVEDIATKLLWTTRHIRNLIEAGELVAINGATRPEETRAAPRVPIEAYQAFIFKRMTAPFRKEFIATLPRTVRVELIAELKASLAA